MINSRKKGHKFELDIIQLLKIFGYEAVSSRSESKNMDNKGVDIIDTSPFYFQCKHVEKLGCVHDILDRMPREKIPVVLHKRNHKGIVAVMRIEDFNNLLLFNDDSQKRK